VTQAPAAVPRLQTLTEGRTFEWTVVLLSCLFAAAGYFDAWTYVNTTSGKSLLEPWQDFALHLSWFLLTAYLVGVIAVNARRGLPIARSLPAGYGWSFVGCIGFSAMVLLDRWAQLALGSEPDCPHCSARLASERSSPAP